MGVGPNDIALDDMFGDIFAHDRAVGILRRICDECAALSRTTFIADYQLYFVRAPAITERNYNVDLPCLLTITQQKNSNLQLLSHKPVRGISPLIYPYKKIVRPPAQQDAVPPVRLVGASDGGIMYTLTQDYICRGAVPLNLPSELLRVCFKFLDAKQATRCAYMCSEWRAVVYQLAPYFLHTTTTMAARIQEMPEAWCTMLAYPVVFPSSPTHDASGSYL